MTSPPIPCAVVVLAAGSGSRVGATVDGAPVNKILLPLAGLPILAHSIRAALAVPGLRRLLVVVRPGEESVVADALAPVLADGVEVGLVAGGASRHASEWAALRALAPEVRAGAIEVVAIHDGARPLATTELFTGVVETAQRHGGAIPVMAMAGLLRRDGSPAPTGLAGVQTPQAFRAAPLLDAYEQAQQDGFEGTDTAACVAWSLARDQGGAPTDDEDLVVAAVDAGPTNLKVTFPEDVALAEALLATG